MPHDKYRHFVPGDITGWQVISISGMTLCARDAQGGEAGDAKRYRSVSAARSSLVLRGDTIIFLL